MCLWVPLFKHPRTPESKQAIPAFGPDNVWSRHALEKTQPKAADFLMSPNGSHQNSRQRYAEIWLNVRESGNQIPRQQRVSAIAKTPNIRCFVSSEGAPIMYHVYFEIHFEIYFEIYSEGRLFNLSLLPHFPLRYTYFEIYLQGRLVNLSLWPHLEKVRHWRRLLLRSMSLLHC